MEEDPVAHSPRDVAAELARYEAEEGRAATGGLEEERPARHLQARSDPRRLVTASRDAERGEQCASRRHLAEAGVPLRADVRCIRGDLLRS